ANQERKQAAESSRTAESSRSPSDASLKRATWRSSKALGPHLASPERLGERLFKSLVPIICLNTL
ncbi:hypothetical protein BHE74_00034916, partial [Ensete ventricosum]